MRLSSIAHAASFAGILVACGNGGAGNVDTGGEPGGPFSGHGYPGATDYRNPGPFSGSGAPGPAGSTDATSLIARVCARAAETCPDTSVASCAASFQSAWNKLTSDCERTLYYAFLDCLLGANFTCGGNGQANTQSCPAPSLSQCGTTSGTTGTGTGSGGTGGSTGGTGGATGGTGGNDTGGSGGTGGATGGTGGATGGTGGTGGRGGTGGTGGRGGTGGTPRDAGRG